jgi:hypothetical protein
MRPIFTRKSRLTPRVQPVDEFARIRIAPAACFLPSLSRADRLFDFRVRNDIRFALFRPNLRVLHLHATSVRISKPVSAASIETFSTSARTSPQKDASQTNTTAAARDFIYLSAAVTQVGLRPYYKPRACPPFCKRPPKLCIAARVPVDHVGIINGEPQSLGAKSEMGVNDAIQFAMGIPCRGLFSDRRSRLARLGRSWSRRRWWTRSRWRL